MHWTILYNIESISSATGQCCICVLLIQKLRRLLWHSVAAPAIRRRIRPYNEYEVAENVSQLRTLIDLGHVGHTLNKFHLLSQHVADLHCKAWTTCCAKRAHGLTVNYSWNMKGAANGLEQEQQHSCDCIDKLWPIMTGFNQIQQIYMDLYGNHMDTKSLTWPL